MGQLTLNVLIPTTIYSSERHAICSFFYTYCLFLIYTLVILTAPDTPRPFQSGLAGGYDRQKRDSKHTHALSIRFHLYRCAPSSPDQDVSYLQYAHADPVRGHSKFHSSRRPSNRLGQSSEWRSRPGNAARYQWDFGFECIFLVLCMYTFHSSYMSYG